MSIESALSFTLAIFIFGITPGPGVFAILARGLSQGATNCIGLALGMTISDAIYLVLACLGLATLAEHWGEVFTVIRIAGALYLCYLAYKLFTAPTTTVQSDTEQLPASSHFSAFIQGFAISASNPKVILFYIAFLPSFMDLTALDSRAIFLAVVLTIVALMAGLMLIAYSAERAGKLMKTPSAVQRLNRFSAALMVAAAGYLTSR